MTCRLLDYCHVWGATLFEGLVLWSWWFATDVLAGNPVLFDLLGACRSGRSWWMVSLVFVPFYTILELIRQDIDPYIMIYTSMSRICGEFHWTSNRRHKKTQECKRHRFNGARICQIIGYFIAHFKVLGLYFTITQTGLYYASFSFSFLLLPQL